MRRYLYILESATVMTVTPTGDTLTDLQTLVGGLIECVPANPRALGITADVWVNEEGLLMPGMSVNYLASVITGRKLFGPCVVTLGMNGETLGLMPAHLRAIADGGMMIDTNENAHRSPAEAAELRFSW